MNNAPERHAGSAAVDIDRRCLAWNAVIGKEGLAIVPREGAALERHLLEGNSDLLRRVYRCVSSFAGHKEILALRGRARRAAPSASVARYSIWDAEWPPWKSGI